MGLFSTWGGKVISLADPDFWRGFFGSTTDSGQVVNFEKALALDAVWACINLKAETCSTLPCIVYRNEDGGSVPATDHPLHEILHDQVNEDDTAPEFWSMAVMSLCLDGNFFAEKKMIGDRLVSLIPLHPLSVKVKRNSRNLRYYEVNDAGKVRDVPAKRMFHVLA